MKRAPMKRTAFKARRPEAPTAEREPHPKALQPATRRASYAGTTAAPINKNPNTVNPHLRNLARNEACTGHRYGNYCHCDPATTVLAHSNSLAHGKGMARKAADFHSAHLGYECHHFLDQSAASAEEKAAFFAAAHERTVARWREIAADPAARPWKRQAAAWAIEQLENNKA